MTSFIDFIIFADDTNLFYSGKNIVQLESTVNNEIKKISEWFNDNELTLKALLHGAIFHATCLAMFS